MVTCVVVWSKMQVVAYVSSDATATHIVSFVIKIQCGLPF